ncbi:MAG: glycosyltransferase family 2 protein [Deinococcales bacterium]|nr:glycosyltransferase family 2 protein [Chitinophagaceae bacterium]
MILHAGTNLPFTVAVLIPLYNEEKNAAIINEAIGNVFKNVLNADYRLLFVDDGSKDGTLAVIKQLAAADSKISYISFSKNFGKEAALLAGFQHIPESIDAVITIDADLQHPPSLIPTLIGHWQQGNDVVYTFREKSNEHVSYFAQFTSKMFYWVMSKLADVELENGIADFKIIDRKVLATIKEMKEDAPFFRGLFKWVGYRQLGVPYIVAPRLSGETKYPTKALIKIALHNITSFSTKPLTMAIYVGFFTSLIAILYIPYVLYSLYNGNAISGWASIIATIAFFGGVQLMVLGIIGLYLGKIFMQTKQRPRYIVNEIKESF